MRHSRAPRDNRHNNHRSDIRGEIKGELPRLCQRSNTPVTVTAITGIWILAIGSILPGVLAANELPTVATARTVGSGDAASDFPKPIPGRWLLQQSIDPLTDERRAIAVLPAENMQSDVQLIASCADGATILTIDWGAFLDDDSRSGLRVKQVTTRLGGSSAKTSNWDITEDDSGTYEPSGKWLLQSMLDHDRYVAQVTPYRSGPITAVFDLTGIREAITPLAEACDWLIDATDLPVFVEFQGSTTTLVSNDIEFLIDPVTNESTQVDSTTLYRMNPGTRGAALIEACRGRSPGNACYVRMRHHGTEVTELLSARAN